MLITLILVVLAVSLLPDLRSPARSLGPPTTRHRSLGDWLAGGNAGRARRRRLLVSDLPNVLEMLARSLRGGANLRSALIEATAHESPAARSLRSVLVRVDAGDRLGDALDVWASHVDDPDADLARAVLRLGDSTGAAVAGSLEQAATSLRDRAALKAELQALSSQARLSSVVIGFAPLAFLVVSASVDPGSAALLVTTEFGLACLALGLGLDLIGVRWMRRIGRGVTQ